MKLRYPSILALCMLASASVLSAQKLSPSITKKIDALFSEYRMPDTPGCALGIYRNGTLVYSRGYGCADLEHAVPIKPGSIFDIGSTSKQFTAASVILLQEDGKLSLDDDIRKYIPELPDYGHTITLRHLLNHTSGLRDYLGLLVMAGYTLGDVVGSDDVLKIITQQRGLDFEPGTKYVYSNTGYVLLGEIVKRVSGKPLREFAGERIFAPLGMTHTMFVDDHSMIIPNRAIGYEGTNGGGFSRSVSTNDQTGDGAVHTNVEDLLKWDENFYTTTVGGTTLIRELERRGVLTGGDTIGYAAGLEFGSLHGLRTVGHDGAIRGYRSQLLRVPSEHLSVAVLANYRGIDPNEIAVRIIEIILADHLPNVTPVAAVRPTPHRMVVKIDTAAFDAYTGDYEMDESPGFIFTFRREGDHYFVLGPGQPPDTLFPESDSLFAIADDDIKFLFHHPPAADRMSLLQGGEHMAHRVTVKAVPDNLAPFAGTYRSPELQTSYTLVVENGKLVARHQRRAPVTLTPKQTGGPPLFAGDNWLLKRVIFDRGKDGVVNTMLVSFARNRDIRFEREH
ncbi:MAG: serine hydrolase domain-containing protein [Candidatus Kapaibacterium sp.]